jgi:hypothetical protein
MRAAWLRLLGGVVLIAAVLFGQTLVGAATAAGRLDPALRDVSAPVNVVVVMDFVPERFHTERLSAYGVFAGRDKAVSRVRLRMVSPENLRRLAALVWVSRIEPGR